MRKVKLLLLLFLIGSCVDPYRPPEITAPNTYLVVDGFLNGGGGTSTIRLTRTENLTAYKSPTVETKATVQAEAEKGGTYVFTEQGSGNYTLTTTELKFGERYRLRIKLTNGHEFASDYVEMKQTPPIDDVSFKAQTSSGLVQFYVDTHDASNQSKYYRWEYEETWEFFSGFYSIFEYKNNDFVPRADNINHCWRNEKSTAIYLGTSTQLSQDVISKYPILSLAYNASNRLKVRYSLLVKQYALSKDAYDFWLNLRNNTEKLGSLFDPQPFQVLGNIHGVTDPNEPVVGFISGYSVQEKRIFVTPPDLPLDWRVPSGYESCEPDTFLVHPPPMELSAAQMAEAGAVPIDGIFSPFGTAIAYRMSTPRCVDCRVYGTTVKPSFW